MAFPTDPLGLTVELLISGTWTALGSLVYNREDLVVTRGRSSESSQVDRSTCGFQLNNRDGRFSPRNPTGIYYGLIGRNTRCRVRLSPAPEAYLRANGGALLAGTLLAGATTPDSANLSITGDIDIRVDIRPDRWGLLSALANKYNGTGNQRSWAFWVNRDNTLSVRWSPDGTLTNAITKTSTAAVTVPTSGRLAVRVTVDVDNGAAGNDVKFYTAPQISRTTLLSGDTSTFESSAGTWGAGNANTTVARSTAQAHSGVASLALTSVAAGNISARSDNNTAGNRFDVTADDEYEVAMWFRAATVARACQILVNWYNGTTFLSQDSSATVTNSTSAWTPLSAVFTAPATATRGAVFGLAQSTAAAGEVHYLDDAQVYGGTTWTQLGATVTTAATTSIFDSTAAVGIGGGNGAVSGNINGRIYAFELSQGIVGTLRADVDLDTAEAGAATFTDGQSNVWTLLNDASIVAPAVRFHGEVSEWPQRWEGGGQDLYVPVEASGIQRRLTQGTSPLSSTLYRALTTLANPPKAYWPCEDGTNATQIASGVGGAPMTVVGTKAFSQFTGFACSEALPLATAAEWKGTVPTYTGTGIIQVWFLMQVPTTGGTATVGQGICSIYTTGTAVKWNLIYETGGDLRLTALDAAGTGILDSGVIDLNLAGKLVRVAVKLAQNGANIDWAVDSLIVGATGNVGLSGTLNTNTVSRCTRVVINPGADLGDIVVGHIAVHDELLDQLTLKDQLNAYVGETAGNRIKRLCSEEGVAFRAVGTLASTSPMGSQLPGELITLLTDAATADQGILYEPRDLFGLGYRTRESLYNQITVAPLDYAAQHLADLVPLDDDQQTRNDITVTRTGGSSFRAMQATGPLSTAAPPVGVGRYDEEVTLNLQADTHVDDAAGWLLHLGTVDEARYPTIDLNLAHYVYTGNQTLTLQAEDLDIGDRLVIDNPPAFLPPDDITQLAQGLVETMGAVTHRIDINGFPSSPWDQTGRYDDGTSRYSSDSTLGGSLTTSATSVSVAFTGKRWSHDDGDFTIRVGGEVMTVTAVAGTTSPQTFTVTRSVNGVVKTHASGETVALDRPVVYVR